VCDPGIHDEERFTIECEVYKDNGGMPHIVREECHWRCHYQVHEYLLIGISVQIVPEEDLQVSLYHRTICWNWDHCVIAPG
jgi:hypothetical protein